MKLRKLGALAFGALLVASACQPAAPGASGSGGGKGTVKIGIELPLQGSDLASGGPIREGVKLAIKEANAAGGVNGWTLADNVQDDAVAGVHDPQQGAKNAQTLVADSAVIGVVGPLNSNVARAQIPITNETGLLQCSPANTAVDLTKPPAALDLRKAFPTRINYVRVATTDDIQGPAGADYALDVLGKKSVFIIDDTETFGKGVADEFEKRFKEKGGTVVGREGAPKTTTDYTPILTNAKTKNPDVVYFGGVTATGGGLIRKQMEQAGMLAIPYVGPDGLQDGSGATAGSFINIAGPSAKDSYSSVAAIGDFPGKADFDKKYKAEYNTDPGSYSASGYACAQIIIEALKNSTATDLKELREQVRAYVADPSKKFQTVLGEISFDANGDTSQKIISFYKVDLAAAEGKGDWIFDKQVEVK